MKKKLLTLCAMFVGLTAFAQSDQDIGLESGWPLTVTGFDPVVETINEKMNQEPVHYYNMQDPNEELRPTYLNAYRSDGFWKYGWFINVQGGVTSFIGKPIGCSDLFDRTRGTVQASIGKWIVPGFGLRAGYQWGQFKNCMLDRQTFQAATLDMLFDPITMFWKGSDEPHWTVTPYLGSGIIHNKKMDYPFTLHYGIIGSYRMGSHVSLNMEIGSYNTFRSFDGYGDKDKFGDQLWSLTAGISVRFGKTRRCKVYDAIPYMEQNKYLINENKELRSENFYKEQVIEDDVVAIEQYRNILRLEGLLDRYRDQLLDGYGYRYFGRYEGSADCSCAGSCNQGNSKNGKPKKDYSRYRKNGHNNYAGFKAFVYRMGKSQFFDRYLRASEGFLPDSLMEDFGKYDQDSGSMNAERNDSLSGRSEYFRQMASGNICIGTPILFFFRLGTSSLITNSQMENLHELANIAKRYDLRVRVIGAADSATGTEAINNSLSERRAQFIQENLIKDGISPDKIETMAIGGTDQYSENETNRLTRVELYF